MAASKHPRSKARSTRVAHRAEKAVPASAAQAPCAGEAGESLAQCVLRSLERYFSDLDGAKPHALHEMVLHAVELPLLKFALERAQGNQSKAAELLGINRNTLHKKLIDYDLIEA